MGAIANSTIEMLPIKTFKQQEEWIYSNNKNTIIYFE